MKNKYTPYNKIHASLTKYREAVDMLSQAVALAKDARDNMSINNDDPINKAVNSFSELVNDALEDQLAASFDYIDDALFLIDARTEQETGEMV